MFSVDAYSPEEIAKRVETVGVKKAGMPLTQMLALSGLAGAFIAFGAVFYTVVVSGSTLGFGITRLLGGLAFSMGLVLVVLAGAELFTGNNLIAMAWASRKVSTADLVRGWITVYAGNAVGAALILGLVLMADTGSLGGGAVRDLAIATVVAKCELSIASAFARGVLCNTLVCLAVWLAMGGRSFVDKFFAVLFPVTAFVTVGFEHCIANLFFFTLGHRALRRPLPGEPGHGQPRGGDPGQLGGRHPSRRRDLLACIPTPRRKVRSEGWNLGSEAIHRETKVSLSSWRRL